MVNTHNVRPTVSIFHHVDLFSVFSDHEKSQLLTLGSVQEVEAHANVVIEGELTAGMYIVMDGVVGIYKANKSEEKSYDIGQLMKGSCFGEMSLVDDHPRSATVSALSPSTLFFLSKDKFNQFLSQDPSRKSKFYEGCITNLVGRLRELNDNYVISQFQLWRSALKKEGKAA